MYEIAWLPVFFIFFFIYLNQYRNIQRKHSNIIVYSLIKQNFSRAGETNKVPSIFSLQPGRDLLESSIK